MNHRRAYRPHSARGQRFPIPPAYQQKPTVVSAEPAMPETEAPSVVVTETYQTYQGMEDQLIGKNEEAIWMVPGYGNKKSIAVENRQVMLLMNLTVVAEKEGWCQIGLYSKTQQLYSGGCYLGAYQPANLMLSSGVSFAEDTELILRNDGEYEVIIGQVSLNILDMS